MNEFIDKFMAQLLVDQIADFQNLNSPFKIQEFLDSMPYIAEERDRSPLNVIRDRQCHCLDGGLFAVLALWKIGYLPQMIDIVPDPGEDDDHVLALYRIEGRWGAVAKSNYVNLGFREPVYKNLRELVMTYFEHYCSVSRKKTLRGYTRPLDLSRYTHLNWALDEYGTNKLFYSHFYGRKFVPLISSQMAKRLTILSERVYKAETIYTDLSWSFGIRPAN
jgi:hypothetical protein